MHVLPKGSHCVCVKRTNSLPVLYSELITVHLVPRYSWQACSHFGIRNNWMCTYDQSRCRDVRCPATRRLCSLLSMHLSLILCIGDRRSDCKSAADRSSLHQSGLVHCVNGTPPLTIPRWYSSHERFLQDRLEWALRSKPAAFQNDTMGPKTSALWVLTMQSKVKEMHFIESYQMLSNTTADVSRRGQTSKWKMRTINFVIYNTAIRKYFVSDSFRLSYRSNISLVYLLEIIVTAIISP